MALTATEEALLRQLLEQQAAILSLAENEATITSKLGATKVTLADLVAASSLNGTDLLLARQGTQDKSLTLTLLKSFASGDKVNKAGDTMTGTLVLSGAPGSANDAATKGYVDTQINTKVNKTTDTMSGALTVNGNLTTGAKLTAPYFGTLESGGDIYGIFGAQSGPVINDNTIVQAHSPVSGPVRFRGSSGGDPTNATNRAFDITHSPTDGTNGVVFDINVDKRYLISFLGADGFAFANSSFGRSFLPTNDNAAQCGGASNRFSVYYAGTGTINTSDRREKTSIDPVDANVLQAWAKVRKSAIKQFRFIDSVERKGDAARYHIGLIAQEIKEAFEAEDIDPFKYGILCYDKWEAEYEDIVEEIVYEETIETWVPFEVEKANFEGQPGEYQNLQTIEIVGEEGGRTAFVRGLKKELQTVRKTRIVPTGEKRLVKAAGDRYGVREGQAMWLELACIRAGIK
jgi:hypothetical protein